LLWEAGPAIEDSIDVIGESDSGIVYVIGDGRNLIGMDNSNGDLLTGPVAIADKYRYNPQALITGNGQMYVGGFFGGEDNIITIDTTIGLPVDSVRVPDKVEGMSLSPDGRRLYTVNK